MTQNIVNLILGKITNEEYQAVKQEEEKARNQQITDAIIAKYGSFDNYRHKRANQICDSLQRIPTKRN